MEKKTQKNKIKNLKEGTTKSGEKDKSISTNNSSKTVPPSKSASQVSISHFSSVSTPEYRQGWDRIWGSNNSNLNKTKVSNENSILSSEMTLLNQDLSENIKVKILKELEFSAKKKGFILPRSNISNLKNIEFSCTINFINK
tara:strand:+ start:59 stop:484 length:426 start_codon:yes stop_codon:yes gene_type:complete